LIPEYLKNQTIYGSQKTGSIWNANFKIPKFLSYKTSV
jgi:hypothetical protein